MSNTKKDLRLSGLMDTAPELQIRNKDQISALPLGSRVIVDPWSDQLRMLNKPTPALVSPKEKMPFQITPFMVYLTRQSESRPISESRAPDNSPANTASPGPAAH